jgi:hypothetical protein
MRVKFVIRGLLLGLFVVLLILGGWIYVKMPLTVLWFLPAPSPATIQAPQGDMPTGTVSFQHWNHYRGRGYVIGGSSFFLRLESGEIVGVMTAHGTSLGSREQPLEYVAFQIAGRTDYVGEFDRLQCLPGRHFTLANMTTDYMLLRIEQPIAPEMLLEPDPRGAPQRGERVALFGGVDGSTHEGTAHWVTDKTVWILMDEQFWPGLMSGSPFVSQHTGRVVGMALADANAGDKHFIGMNPIGAIVERAESSTEFPKMNELHK